MDENYQTYLNRAMRSILPETYRSQVQHIQESPKFLRHETQGYQPDSFPGYSILTPPGPEDSANSALYSRLKEYQEQVIEQLGAEVFVPVPPESFHLTLADLIWASAYHHAVEKNPEFEPLLRQQIAQIFQQCQPLSVGQTISFQVLGLIVMPRAISACLVPTDELSYQRLLKFRRAIFQNHDLIGLGIEQQYYFTPHITLGYFGSVPAADARQEMGDRIVALNQQWVDGDVQKFFAYQAELRKFDDMTRYYRAPDWAMFKF